MQKKSLQNRNILAGEDVWVNRNLVAPQGFEPRLSESESLVLPLNEGAKRLLRGRAIPCADQLLECTRSGVWGQCERVPVDGQEVVPISDLLMGGL